MRTNGPAVDLAGLTEIRVREPERIERAWRERRRRPLVGRDGRLMMVAADHPARNALGVRGDPLAMADRGDLLGRLATALAVPGVDGVLATPDILEDLLLLGALEDKVVVGSMNRGGLQGAAFELDDRFTGYDPAGIVRHGLDAAKTLTRICLDDPGSLATLTATAEAITALAEQQLPVIVEPFWSIRGEHGAVVNQLDPASVIRSVQVVAGLGSTSAYTWLKLPVVEGMDQVMASTTLPTLLLGGDPAADPQATYETWRESLALNAVRGLVIGRTLLYPPDGDVVSAVRTAVRMVHGD